MSRRGERPTPETLATLPVAVDAMGGDKAPGEVVEGARRAADEHGIGIVLVGPPDQVGDTQGLELVACTEVIGMDEDPAGGVRRKKDSSLVRAAELVRDGKACAMVSAGNTGATMASALLRMGRLPGVVRPCIATRCRGWADPGRAGRRRRQRRVHGRHAGAVRADGGRLRVRPLRHRGRPRWGSCPSARSPRRARPSSRRPTGCWWRRRRGLRVRGEPRGPRPVALARPTSSSPTGSPATSRSSPSRARCVSSSTPCWHLRHRRRDQGRRQGPAAPPAPAGGGIRAREHRRGHAARDRRRLRHQPRLVECNGHDERRRSWRTSVPTRGLADHVAAAVRPAENS